MTTGLILRLLDDTHWMTSLSSVSHWLKYDVFQTSEHRFGDLSIDRSNFTNEQNLGWLQIQYLTTIDWCEGKGADGSMGTFLVSVKMAAASIDSVAEWRETSGTF